MSNGFFLERNQPIRNRDGFNLQVNQILQDALYLNIESHIAEVVDEPESIAGVSLISPSWRVTVLRMYPASLQGLASQKARELCKFGLSGLGLLTLKRCSTDSRRRALKP
ncbi:hypothetical protein PCASD_01708 [Puccinia coronata f. sp. avenae]|uniref:Uncharacterized protein n=1 Tax=Puccinia coronata f. sp. avenae TaxID=200324 RepID=A0A2N5VJV9_9BASI|nr:hypothetical protein PCASD_01708 [Puccinia coronata f. sp. avenae]